jgi:hypothetical protein
MYGMYFRLVKNNRKITRCNRLDLGNTRILTDYVQKSPRTLVMTIGNDSDGASGSLTEDLYKQKSQPPSEQIIHELKCLELRRVIATLLS